MALAATTRERVYLVQLLNGMNNGCGYTPVTVDEDNQGATALSKNPVCRQRGKHVDIKYHFVRCALCDGKKTIEYCPATDMVTDILTKPVTRIRIDAFRRSAIHVSHTHIQSQVCGTPPRSTPRSTPDGAVLFCDSKGLSVVCHFFFKKKKLN